MPDYAASTGGGAPVLLLHTWWGLNQQIKDLADRLARDGFTVLAPDLFEGRVLTTIEEADAHGQEMDAQADRIHGVVSSALDALLAQPDADGDRVGIVALSFGGWYARQAAERRNDIAALVSIYSDVYDTPDGVAYQGHFASDDQFVDAPPAELDEAYVYPGTKHWFMEADRPEYDAEAAEQAYARTVEFLHRHVS
ncbi:MAG: dienelactone hydrolase family protein [Gaiellaceae bacterium]